jgi:hypothetical protein
MRLHLTEDEWSLVLYELRSARNVHQAAAWVAEDNGEEAAHDYSTNMAERLSPIIRRLESTYEGDDV